MLLKGTKRRGGAREGSGPKPKERNHSEKTKKRWSQAAEKILKETGMSVEEHWLRMSIAENVQAAVRSSFAKLYNEALLVKESKQVTEKIEKPKIVLAAKAKADNADASDMAAPSRAADAV